MGATSGIGCEVAKLLASKGYQVAIAGRREARLNELQSAVPGIVASKVIDICSDEAPQLLLQLAHEMGGIDLYFHSSGIGFQNLSLNEEKEMSTVETNALGFTRMIGTAFRYFTDKGSGHIAVISSIAGTKGLGAAPAYSATKRFQTHYLECLSQQARMRQLPVRITDIRPGFVATDLIAGSNFPLQLSADSVAADIVKAVEKGREVVTIDCRYRLLVAFWRLLPRSLWVRLRFVKS